MRKILQLLVAVSVFSTNTLYGQNLSGKADKETLKMIIDAREEKGRETGALIILRDYSLTVDENKKIKLVIRVVGKVFSSEAVSDYARINIRYNSFNEEPELNYARVIYQDGTTREVRKDAVQIKTTPESEGFQYTDSRDISFALSGLEPGAAFEYMLTFNQKTAIIEGEWFDNHLFANVQRTTTQGDIPRVDPVLTSVYTLLVPRDSQFKYHLYSFDVNPVKRSLKEQDEYKWVVTGLKEIKIENGMPPVSSLIPVVVVSSISDWSVIDQWARKKILDKAVINDEIIAKVNELTAGKVTRDEKIRAISSYIQANFNYIYADLDRGGYEAHQAGEIFRSRYGDCKDQTVLLITMLKVVGIDAWPALINPFPGDEYTEIPTPQFSHLITYIPDNEGDKWLDMTSGVTPYPSLFFSDQGRTAFIINGKGGLITKTPMSTSSDNKSVFDLQASFTGERCDQVMKISSSGVTSDILKSLFKLGDQQAIRESMGKTVKAFMEKAVIDYVNTYDLKDSEVNFSTTIGYHFDDAWSADQQGFIYESQALIPLILLTSLNPEAMPETRSNDVVEGYSYMIEGSERYSPPGKDLLPIEIPMNDSIDNGYFRFNRSFSTDGNNLQVKWSLTSEKKVIRKEDYETYLGLLRTFIEKTDWNVTYVDPVTYIPALISKETTGKIQSYCNQLLRDNPGNIFALLLNGMNYGRTGQSDLALNKFQEVLKISPDNKYAFLFSFFTCYTKNNHALAMDYLNKAIGSDPDFEPALLARASYYIDKGQIDRAKPDVDKVYSINPRNLFCLTIRAFLFTRAGKEEEAVASIEEAYMVDSTNVEFCSFLAQSYLARDDYRKAIRFYNQAILLDGTNPTYYGNLGWAYYLADDDVKCIEYSTRAIELKPDSYYARYNIGLSNLRMGNFDVAHRIYAELKKEKSSIDQSEKDGAVADLNDLLSKGIYVEEVKTILKEYFGK